MSDRPAFDALVEKLGRWLAVFDDEPAKIAEAIIRRDPALLPLIVAAAVEAGVVVKEYVGASPARGYRRPVYRLVSPEPEEPTR